VDFGMLGRIDFSMQFVMAFLSIVLIDLILAGDNAVVIAMAVRCLPKEKRFWGIVAGAAGAVILRVACTFVVAQLLIIEYVKLLGGAVIIWIAIKLMVEGGEEEEGVKKEATSILQAFWIIIVADISMSIDNMLAVGAASKGNLFLLIFGLALSIPFVVGMSNLLCKLMERFPIIMWVGAIILGKVGGEMMISDPFIHNLIHPSKAMEYATMIFCVAFVVVVSKWIIKRAVAKAKAEIVCTDVVA
jgi:YjbE family integral membrane protein